MRIIKILAAAAVLQLGLAQPALADEPNWVRVTNSDNGESEHWIDSTSLKRKGDLVSYRERAEINDSDTDWASVIAFSQIDCKTSMVHPVQLNITYTNGKSETVDNPDPSDWNEIQPDSVGSDIRDYVCKS
ncbi:surface-adhesin E family protein [Novosphingobium sp.]|uniref:surface-adhesin E family protein n=1 Tax=Novosphingobium sp. TaxID=1874826 RepID=UPI00286B4CE9|nr:surface-adhesin E family protein [Novosphingobium sp.]